MHWALSEVVKNSYRQNYHREGSSYLAEDSTELGPHEAVDEDVDGGVEDEEDVGEEAKEDAPDREATEDGVLAPSDVLDNWGARFTKGGIKEGKKKSYF